MPFPEYQCKNWGALLLTAGGGNFEGSGVTLSSPFYPCTKCSSYTIVQVQKTNSELYVNIYCPVFCRVAACLPRHSGGPGYPWLAGLAGARLLTSLFMQPSCCHHPDTTPPPPTSSSEVTNYPQYPPGIFVHFRCPLHVHAQLHTYCYALALDLWSV